MKDFKELGKGFLVYILYLLLPSFLAAFCLYLNIDYTKQNFIGNLVNIIIYLVTASTLGYIFRNELITQIKDLQKNWKNHLKKGAFWWLIGLGIMVCFNIIFTVILTNDIPTNESTNQEILSSFPLFGIITMIFILPFIEEIVYRLAFKKTFNKMIPFIIFSGVFFGLVHIISAFESIQVISKNWIQFLYIIPYGALGFGFAGAYYSTDNIFTSTIFHMLHNAIAICAILFLGGVL